MIQKSSIAPKELFSHSTSGIDKHSQSSTILQPRGLLPAWEHLSTLSPSKVIALRDQGKVDCRSVGTEMATTTPQTHYLLGYAGLRYLRLI